MVSLPVYAPVSQLMLYLTEECNMRCSYCFLHKEPRTMSQEIALRTMDYFLQRNISGSVEKLSVTFFGGEPFLAVDRMQQVIDYAQQPRTNVHKEFHFSATTNGTLANSRVEKAIRSGSLHLLISLDGGPEVSQARPMISGRNSYDFVAQNLAKLVAWSPQSTVRMTFTPQTLDFVAQIKQVLSLGEVSLALCPVIEADWSFSRQDLEKAYEELGNWFLQQFHLGHRPPLESTWKLLAQQAFSCGQRPSRPCPVGHSLLAVDSQGQVLPCHRFLHRYDQALGSVEAQDFEASRWPYVHLKTLEIEDCSSCQARKVCGGGCRAVAPDLEKIHPNHCLLLRAHMRQVLRILDEIGSQPRFLSYLRDPQNHLSQLASLGS